MLAQIGEIEDLVNMAQEVMGGNVGIEVERVEQTRFAAALASHHPGLAVERSHPSIAAGALCSRCFSTESAAFGLFTDGRNSTHSGPRAAPKRTVACRGKVALPNIHSHGETDPSAQ